MNDASPNTTASEDPVERLVTNQRLDSFELQPQIAATLERLGLTHATPIQARTLPRALAGGDLTGQAQTGTGKTAAFLLAIINRLLDAPQPTSNDQGPAGASAPRALIIAPTRELAEQIDADARALTADTDLATTVCYGGTGYHAQREALGAGTDILIGTPGRLIDYYKQKIYTLRRIETVVLDEADRMFDLGFISDIRYMLRRMPPPIERQSMLFSATLSHRVLELAYEHMNDPVSIEADEDKVDIDAIDQRVYHVSKDDKAALLIGLLRSLSPTRTLVFINTKRVGERLTDMLQANGFNASILSGDVAQNKRQRLLENFKSGELQLLVATDVAARGLHIPDVSHVVNFDLPQNAEDYVHRIGRTARAGNSGTALSLACEDYVYSLPDIETFIDQKLTASVPADSDFAVDLTTPNPRSKKRGGQNGRRRSGRSAGQKPAKSSTN
ncbi:DEAD/DEAH box helicase [Salinisphaera orenii]|uniref:DEAD/DEAH box helicase n=1 Tax=Salinisphaera orenii TaxID=856731 RepID=UPI000DBEA983